MTTDTKSPYTQFFTLMNSKLPDEYKAVLQKFQEHGDFYQQLINITRLIYQNFGTYPALSDLTQHQTHKLNGSKAFLASITFNQALIPS